MTNTALGQRSKAMSLIDSIEAGGAEAVRGEIVALAKEYPDESAWIYLQGLIESDADKSIQFYQAVVQRYPASEWADDALYRLYQYNYAIGAYNTADRLFSRLETEYPSSPWCRKSDKKAANPGIDTSSVPVEYSVQVGAYSSEDVAQVQAEEMKKLGYTAEVKQKTVGEKRLCAVLVGRFPSLETARSFARKLQSRHKLDPIVIRR
jgi:hypothetical protein